MNPLDPFACPTCGRRVAIQEMDNRSLRANPEDQHRSLEDLMSADNVMKSTICSWCAEILVYIPTDGVGWIAAPLPAVGVMLPADVVGSMFNARSDALSSMWSSLLEEHGDELRERTDARSSA